MSQKFVSIAVAMVIGAGPLAAHAGVLRVCADPDYLPFSNAAGEGFENKVAALVAGAMGDRVQYTWASYRGHGGYSNFLADTLDAKKCDVVMDLPTGDQEEGYTNPYYTSSYVFVSKKTNDYTISSMGSQPLRMLKIGYEEDTTPQTALMMLGLIGHSVPFHVSEDPAVSPDVMLQAVETGQVGVMITWQPAIGYDLKNYPDLAVSQVPAEEYGPGLPQVSYTYSMSLGVRPSDVALKAALNRALATEKNAIGAVLAQGGVKVFSPKMVESY